MRSRDRTSPGRSPNRLLLAPSRQLNAPSLVHDEDHALLVRCREGDDEAFGVLVDRYKDRVGRLAYQMLNDPDEAEDIAQETFVKLYASLHSFRGEAALFTWLYRVVVNTCHRRASKLRRNSALSLEQTNGAENQQSNMDSPHQEADRKERDRVVRGAVTSLSPKYRATVVLRYFHDLSYREIAEVLRVPIGTVESRLHDARRILKQRITAEFAGG